MSKPKTHFAKSIGQFGLYDLILCKNTLVGTQKYKGELYTKEKEKVSCKNCLLKMRGMVK